MFYNKALRKIALGTAAMALALGGIAAPVQAQRDPAYQTARTAGQVGEKIDGYLGTVGSQPSTIQRLVSDINIKRKANYTDRAQAQNVTVEEYARAQGCTLILRTGPGEKYQAPDGSWKTRTSAPPERHPSCP
jgi:hypothetical protein